MSILIDENTKVLCQGITDKEGSYYTKKAILYGTSIVAGVTPEKGGFTYLDIPIYNSVKEAIKSHIINATIIYVSSKFAIDSIVESIDCNIEIVICITKGIPVLDMIFIKNYLFGKKSFFIGPNCTGIISPKKCKLGTMPEYIYLKGCVGIVSNSGTLIYEAVYQITLVGLGQSTCVDIGEDKILGLTFVDVIKMFQNDSDTKVILMIGKIGCHLEIDAGIYIKNNITKPVFVYIAGVYFPIKKKIGHSEVIVYNNLDTVEKKNKILLECGVKIIKDPSNIGLEIKNLLIS